MASVADYNVANASGAAVRSDLNNIFQAVVTLNSGTSEPSTMYPFMLWIDTNNNLVKMRNGANDAWLTMPFAMNASDTAPNGLTVSGGDLTVDTSTLKVDSTNNRVGVNTASPGYPLHVVGSTIGLFNSGADATLYLGEGESGGQYGWIKWESSDDTIRIGTQTGSDTIIVNESGQVGINTSSPARQLHLVNSGNALMKLESTSASGYGGIDFANASRLWFAGVRDDLGDGFGIRDETGGAIRLAIDTSGNVGIGASSPSQLLHISDTGSAGIYLEADSDNVNEDHVAEFHMSSDGGATYHKLGTNNNNHGYINVSEALVFWRQGSEKARLDSSGRLLVGTTGVYIDSTDKLVVSGGRIAATVASANSGAFNRSTSTGDIVAFLYNGSGKGSISTDGSNVAYNTSSDARLKNVLGDAKGLDIVNQLNPVHFEWKETGKTQDGLIAQEVEPLIPESVSTNEQTGFYEMDYSKLVTPLIKAVQEQQEQIEELKQQINELRGN